MALAARLELRALVRAVGHEVLDVGRVRNGKIAVQRRLVDLADVAASAVATLTDAGKLAQHTLTVHADPVFVEVDPVRIEQVVVNLLSNAVKYTPAGGSIDVSTLVEKVEAVLRLSDTGIGIPPDLLPRLFGLFVQGERAPQVRAGGLGIGLALVRWIVGLHGGHVSAKSAGSGKGAPSKYGCRRRVPSSGWCQCESVPRYRR